MTFDVAACLEQGRPSVSNTQTYVTACHTLGYQHPDLTANGTQVLERYGAEEGMDLALLDDDCARLRSAASAAEEVVRLEREAAAALAAAWSGGSASAADEFVDRHCEAATAVAGMLRSAADMCTALRDTLWRLVGDKVHAAVTIDDRRAEVRPAWLAAARTVTGGSPDRAEAVDVVTHQITPYVDGDIRTDWIGAMRTATTAVAAAYDNALHRLNAHPPTHFDVPAQLAPPILDRPRGPATVTPVPTAVTVPAAAHAEPAIPAAVPPPAPAPPAPAALASDVPAPQPVPTMPAASGIGGAAPGSLPGEPGGGLSGLAGQIAQALGGLFTTTPDSTAPNPADPAVDEPKPDDGPAVDEAKDVEAETDSPDPPAEESTVPEEAGPVPPPEEPVTDETPPPVVNPPVPPAVEPPAPEHADERTPCEIAADELPQVGQ